MNFNIECTQENIWTNSKIGKEVKTLEGEYDRIWKKIVAGENFALLRFADGEATLLKGEPMNALDGWKSPAGMTNLGWELRKSLRIKDPRVFYGISCPCCDSANYLFYSQQIQNHNITFSNLFVNSNYQRFKRDFLQLERDAILITNVRGRDKTYGKLNVKKHFFIEDNFTDFWDQVESTVMPILIEHTRDEKNTLFVVSAGPLSEVIIAQLFKHNPNNCYIDFGSAIDFITHERATRGYHLDKNPDSKRNCWMFDPQKFRTDVDVVLTTYKRPYTLKMQLDAVENQTLKPQNIFLFQDGIDDCYSINFDPKFLARFDDVQISKKNYGVWKRFEYAAKIAKSKYVCIFDDDTIPGRRWLESCIMHATQHRAVYGTNGILLKSIEEYPEDHQFIGWLRMTPKTTQVDFVGHSWFVEREFLDWMLEKTTYTERYKTAGEDMTLSFACQEHGIPTIVPAHPNWIRSIWGSQPETGIRFGTDAMGLSMNAVGHENMKTAINEIHSDGWRFLYETNPHYVKSLTEKT